MKKAAFFNDDPQKFAQVYGMGRRQRVAEITELYPEVVSADHFASHIDRLRQTEVIFSTWGMPQLEPQQWDRLPVLKAVFYAAGSVKRFAPPLLERGIVVMSSWGANAVSVAEFTLGQILLSCKGFFRNTRQCRLPEKRRGGQVTYGRGVFGETVGLIGAGMVGRALCALLRHFELRVVVCDLYLSDAQAEELGVEKVELDELFAQAYVVSNHLPNIAATRHMLTGRHFDFMRQDATFINTGRGAQVVEAELIEVLQRRPDLTALLDVTDPEPPGAESPLYTLPNVQMSSHIAGALNDEVVRLADYAIEEFLNWEAGRPLRYAVTTEMLEIMA